MRAAPHLSRRAALIALAGVAGSLFAAGCARTDVALDPVWGKEPCAHCRMLVGDKRYAAQVAGEAERRYFDDIGCMVLWLDAHGPRARAWVRDATGQSWLDATRARYVAGARTPMDFGFEARAAAPEGVGFDAMGDAVRAKNRSTR